MNSKIKIRSALVSVFDKNGIEPIIKEFEHKMPRAFALKEQGNVQLTPKILKNSQEFISKKFGVPKKTINFVFHGGSSEKCTAIDLYPNNVCAIHIDHGYESHIIDGINSGIYTSVMIDASHDPIEKNIQRTKLIVDKAHKKNISVEAELGILSGQEDDIDVDEQEAKFTNPEDVEYFVQKTNCDSLAVAVGTSHGAYKFSGGGKLRLDILRKIQERLPRFPIVLHGASTIDKNEVDRINNAGGSLKNSAKGVSESDIKEAIKLGVCKINIATDLRLLWTRIFREFFRDSSGEWDHLKPGKKYMEELEILLEKKFKLLLCVEKNNLF